MLDQVAGMFKDIVNRPSVIILSSMIGGQYVMERFNLRLLPDYQMYDDLIAAGATILAVSALLPSQWFGPLAGFDVIEF